MCHVPAHGAPNILLFATDDHGQWAAPCYACPEIRAPSLQYLASRGVRCTQAFTPTPVCSPARASLLTGLLPSQHGIHDYLNERVEALDHPGIRNLPTLGTHLHHAGYRTGLVGKWHCGRTWEPAPGFDRWFTFWDRQYPYLGDLRYSDQGRELRTSGYCAEIFTQQALDFLRTSPPGQPWFLMVNYVDTHAPYTGHPPRLVESYRGVPFASVPNEPFNPVHGQSRWTPPAHEPQRRSQALAEYAAAVTFIDEQVGRLLDQLQSTGQDQDTLVVYTSDHGHMNGHHGLHLKGNVTTPQNFLDEAIRVPLLCSWPNGLPAASTCAHLLDHTDVFATLLHAATGHAPTDPRLPGRSALDILRGDSTWHRDATFCEYGNARMIRTAAHKLICRYPGPNGRFPDELYDLVNDPRETENVIAAPAHAAALIQLRQQLEDYFARYTDPHHDGRRLDTQPRCNPDEPWRRT